MSIDHFRMITKSEHQKEKIIKILQIDTSYTSSFPTNKMFFYERLRYTILFAISSYRSVFFLIFEKVSFTPLDHPYSTYDI